MQKYIIGALSGLFTVSTLIVGFDTAQAATGAQFTAIPPFVSSGAPPLVMLAMGRDHKLYYEAYNDASDLDGDDKLDIHYKPSIDYYGYFDSYKCYTYSTAGPRFNPTSINTDKKCSGADEWSGDFLNYLTMSRMDTVRKVLYGGYRSTDTATETVLQRVYIPRDAHSWGKEYTSVAVDGYEIADYTPFTAPAAGLGLRHLFASTTFTSPTSAPLLRYALNNPHRIWDWLVKEAPILNNSAVETTGGTTYATYPNNHAEYETLVTTYATATYRYGSSSWLNYSSRNHASELYPIPSAPAPSAIDFGAIDGAGNPWGTNYDPYTSGATQQEHYLAVFTGKIKVAATGDYTFGVDGDDAVEVIVKGGTAEQIIVGDYGGHGRRGSPQYIAGTNNVQVYPSNTTHLVAGVEYRIEFRLMESGGSDQYYLYWNGPDSGSAWKIIPAQKFTDLTLSTYHLDRTTLSSTVVDREVRVKVCDENVGLETNCKQYPNGHYKPIGLLQRHGEAKRMYFGLMTGSYAKSTSGGVLRKRIGDISDEIETTTTGAFKTSVNGIIQTLNKLRIYGFDYGSYSYNKNCGWITTDVMHEGQCRDWGNPIGEIMYEATRYFAGKGSPTAAFDYVTGSANDDDSKLIPIDAVDTTNDGIPDGVGLPKVDTWKNPYDKADGGFDSCSKPFMLVISDINPNFDTDQLPGVDTNLLGAGIAGDLPGLNVRDIAKNTISATEGLKGKKRFIGRFGTTFDGVCSEKTLYEDYMLGSVSGLCPEEPTKRGGYYSASVAYYAHTTDLQTSVDRDQKVITHAVGLASPLPKIELKIGPDKKLVTLVPFGKTVANRIDDTSHSAEWGYKPTNTITDFFVEELGATYGRFQLNFEDVEQGADHDMDAVVKYEYQLVDAADNNVSDPLLAEKVKITLTSTEASGSYIQHLGYIISGTTADRPYLEVRDLDTEFAADFYWAGGDTLPVGDTTGKIPQVTSRPFTPAIATTATTTELLPNPLWYAAKYGAFEEEDNDKNGIPDQQKEWDKDGNGIPDTYYYVSNPLRLEEQLNKSFADILNKASSGTAASVISNTRSGEGAVYQSIFFPERSDSVANTVNWVGQLHALLVDSYGNMREDSNHNGRLDVSVKDLDLNHDGKVVNEDVNNNCVIDHVEYPPTHDYNGDGVIDSNDYLTEDLNGDNALDNEYTGCIKNASANPFFSQLDAIVVFKDGKINRYYDVNGNGILDPLERQFPAETDKAFDEANYLWNSSNWLNTIADTDIVTQRSTYLSTEKKRYIFTWADANSSGTVDSNEVQDFIWPTSGEPTAGTINTLADTSKFYAYLNLYPSFGDRPSAINSLSDPNFKDFLVQQTKREINWIRGLDDPKPLKINTSDLAGTEMRARKYNGQTWRLGDIAYSTPTTVGAPAEAYHLLYKDASYDAFYRTYQKRRNVIYAGANDGMLHAFNGGFYDSYSKQFCREMMSGYDPFDSAHNVACVPEATTTQPELGAELWAYVPYNLLPHLYWLTQTNYTHIYYVDQKPRIFDAKVFAPGTTDVNGKFVPDTTHVNGWGTIMVVGMRFGGATITADVDKTDGAAVQPDLDRTMKSAYIIFDITDPEQKPVLLGEIAMPNMGFSTSYPTMVVMRDGDHDKIFGDYVQAHPENGENRWLLAFGSGPANASGAPDSTILNTAESSQHGEFYLLDMVQLARYNELWSLTDAGTTHGVLTKGLYPYYQLPEAKSFVTDPITVDYDLDYNADALYYGTIAGSATDGWGGVMHRIVLNNEKDPKDWLQDKVLIDLNQTGLKQPITSGATIALDDDLRNWVFFGTGRYFVSADALDKSPQSYYGIKEPIDSTTAKAKTWDTVTRSTLVNTTNYHVFTDEDQTVTGPVTSTWDGLLAEQTGNDEQPGKDGWYQDFLDWGGVNYSIEKGERNLGQAALLGGLLSFTTFIPSNDVCVAGGESFLWALYYKPGKAYYDSILGTRDGSFVGKEGLKESLPKTSLGQGLATSPNIHVGSEDGSAVFVQTSTGDIIRIEEKNPLATKSGKTSWRQR